MQKASQTYVLSAGDLTGHLGCAHRTNLNRAVAAGALPAPAAYADPMFDALIERGRRHERAYVERLREQGLQVLEIGDVGVTDAAVTTTRDAMAEGVAFVVQGALRQGQWSGRADVLRRVEKPSSLGAWSYEALDTKLARETTGATVLQLCLYSDLLSHVQGLAPEYAHVVTPGNGNAVEEAFRVEAYSAFYRRVKCALEASLAAAPVATYPELVPACDICRWTEICDAKRHMDDHPSLVAGLGRNHVTELREHDLKTLTGFAEATLDWKPRRGALQTYEHLQLQAKTQLQGKITGTPYWELIAHREGLGLARLPAPSPGDIFFDIEGDPFVGVDGLEYLFGYAFRDGPGDLVYCREWATNAAQEKQAFEGFIDFVLARQQQHPGLHIYHFAPYEPAALKRLMGRYATREDALDGLLRSERFVDLFSVVRNGVRMSVESYSIKKLERFYSYARQAILPNANRALARVQAALELNEPLDELADERQIVERYNEDDCRSTAALRDWLELRRDDLIASGAKVQRPDPKQPDPSEHVTQRAALERALTDRLSAGIPVDAAERNADQQARWLMAQLVGWHRREDKASFHELYRLKDLSPEDLMDERCGLSGLVFEKEIEAGKTPVHRYRFPSQETELREGDGLRAAGGTPFGSVRAISAAEQWIDIKKRKDTAGAHAGAVYEFDHVDSQSIAEAVRRVGGDIADRGMASVDHYKIARDLLLRRAPNPPSGLLPIPPETLDRAAVRVIGELTDGAFPIQGPPGAGKTYTGAHMIAALVTAGKKVGVTATSHRVILHLLEEAAKVGAKNGTTILCVHKGSDDLESPHPNISIETKSGKAATRAVLDALGATAHVVGGTAWLWANPDAVESVDVLFVDEAAQMSLANVIAVSQATKTLVLLGDPRQLEQPSKGSHPDGADASALDHLLDSAKTIADDQGLFLAETWRLHPKICHFTSTMFYESRLHPKVGLDAQRVTTGGRLNGAGLRFLPITHAGNQNSSIEEVDAIKSLVAETLDGQPTWVDRDGKEHGLTLADILIVAPYNAQVFALREALPNANIGTVDKFQGQEAPIVIYSMASSSAGDAPRGMEFLYSLNRLNVATSRAQALCVLVASPTLFEAECRTPRQMELTNALCRYKEIATEI